MIKLGLLKQGFFFALYVFTYKDFKLAAVKDYNIRKWKIMIAAMKNLKKIANKNSKTKLVHWEKRKEEIQQQQLYLFHYTGRSYRIATVLQVFNYFKNWRWCKVKILLFKNIDNYFESTYINSTLIYTQNYRNWNIWSKLTFSQKLVIVNPKKFVEIRCS